MKRTIVTLGLAVIWGVGTGCGDSGNSANKPGETGGAGTHPVTAPVDYIGAVGKAQRRAETTVDLAGVQRAIQMFHAMEDRYPKDLQELVNQRYLPSLPAPPVGTRMLYDPASGQVRIVQ